MIYIKRSDGEFCTYEGMSEASITALWQERGLTCEFIDEQTYRTGVLARPRPNS